MLSLVALAASGFFTANLLCTRWHAKMPSEACFFGILPASFQDRSAASQRHDRLAAISRGAKPTAAKKARSKAAAPSRGTAKGFGAKPKGPSIDDPPEDFDTTSRVLPILQWPHPLLRAPNAEVTEFGPRLRQLVANLWRTLKEEDDIGGVGLAAPQVGVNQQVLVFSLKSIEGFEDEEEMVFINPKIVSRSEETSVMDEQCLSFPDMNGDVERPVTVEVEAVDMEGRPYSVKLEGLPARVFQHECDHLLGKLYIDYLDKPTLSQAKPSLIKMKKDYTAAGGLKPTK